MATIKFRGMSSGTQKKVSKAGKDYAVTTFVEIPSMKSFDIFGDLGIPAHEDVREYEFDANIVQLGNVTVKNGSAPAKK
jgi:hypothetical protein